MALTLHPCLVYKNSRISRKPCEGQAYVLVQLVNFPNSSAIKNRWDRVSRSVRESRHIWKVIRMAPLCVIEKLLCLGTRQRMQHFRQ